jgi:hypothetical protein
MIHTAWIGETPADRKIVPYIRVCKLNQGLQFSQDEQLEFLKKILKYILKLNIFTQKIKFTNTFQILKKRRF